MSRLQGAKSFHFVCLLILCGCLLLLQLEKKLKKQTLQSSRKVEIASERTHFRDFESTDNGNNSCIKKNVSLSEGELPLTGLGSFPGSGNTWTRHLIQQMTCKYRLTCLYLPGLDNLCD